MPTCPECGGEVKLPPDPLEGELVTCPECGASFELAREGDSFTLKPAQLEGEDWGE